MQLTEFAHEEIFENTLTYYNDESGDLWLSYAGSEPRKVTEKPIQLVEGLPFAFVGGHQPAQPEE